MTRNAAMKDSSTASHRPLSLLVGALPAVVPFVPPEALERRAGRRLALRLGANESAFGPSPKARDAMAAALADVSLYADPEGFELRTALARQNRVDLTNIVLGCGIDELLGLIVRAHVDPGTPVVMSAGAYPTFAFHVKGFGGSLHTVPYRNDANDLEALAAMARETGARLLYVANPDNPTGSWQSGADQLALLDALPDSCLLVLDEAYHEFAPPGTLPQTAAEDPRLIRLRTFSKAHGMAGLRLGYGIAAASLIATFDKIRNHFGVNRLAQTAALASLGDPDHIAGVIREVEAGRNEYAALAKDLGLPSLPSATNFVAIDVGSGQRAAAILELLLHQDGVFIRMPGVAPLNRCIRVTVGTAPERAAFAEALAAVLKRIPA
jgi:histidinol-phosphate aminotransferase